MRTLKMTRKFKPSFFIENKDFSEIDDFETSYFSENLGGFFQRDKTEIFIVPSYQNCPLLNSEVSILV